MEILKFPHPNLFKVCTEVTVFSDELKILLESMWETMIKNNGVGLAANQVNLNFSMFVMQGPDKEKIFLVNPKIIKKSIVKLNTKEGCLSAPGEFIALPGRSSWVQIEYQNENGKLQKRTFHGIYSICVQHETDHLLGKCYMQSYSLPRSKRKELAKKWKLP